MRSDQERLFRELARDRCPGECGEGVARAWQAESTAEHCYDQLMAERQGGV